MALQLKGNDLREAFARLRMCIVEGKDDYEIAKDINLSWDEVVDLRKQFYDNESSLARNESTEHTFVKYAMAQEACIKDLEKIIEEYGENKKNSTSVVSAIRAKSEILDKILKTGQELGLVEGKRKDTGSATIDAIKKMSDTEIKKFIYQEIQVFNNTILQFGEQDILDMDPGPLYKQAIVEKTPIKSHKRNKVNKGRKVVHNNK